MIYQHVVQCNAMLNLNMNYEEKFQIQILFVGILMGMFFFYRNFSKFKFIVV